MARRRYRSPILMDLVPEDPEFPSAGSQEGYGDDPIYTFEDPTLADELSGEGYFVLSQIDTDGDGNITWEEYNTWAGIEP